MPLPKRPPLDIMASTSLAKRIRAHAPRVGPRQLHYIRMGVGLVAALLMVPGTYVTGIIGALLFVAILVLRQSTIVLHSLLREKPDVSDIRIEHLVSTFILVLMMLCIGVGQIKVIGAQSVGLALLAVLFIAALRVLLIYRAEQQADRPVWQYTWKGYNAEDLLYLFPLIALASQIHLIPPAAVIITPLLILWALYRVIRDN